MLSQRENAEKYLRENYYPDMTGAQLAQQINIPSRSARRYLRNYREGLVKTYPSIPRLNVQPQFFRSVVFDIETTDFGTEGYAGHLVCCSFVELESGETETLEIRFDEGRNDFRLIQDVAKKLAHYTQYVTR